MSNNQQLTLYSFFSSDKKVFLSHLPKAEPSEKISSLKDKVTKEEKVEWPVLSGKIEEKIDDLLDIPIPDILGRAWKKYKELLKYTDREKYPPEVTSMVNLYDHTVKSEHNPYLEVKINEKLIGKIDFHIVLSLAIKGILLKIQDGKIIEITTGTIKGKGTVKCEDYLILEKESETFNLPGSIDLGDGIPISV
jgi:hypothetical protein